MNVILYGLIGFLFSIMLFATSLGIDPNVERWVIISTVVGVFLCEIFLHTIEKYTADKKCMDLQDQVDAITKLLMENSVTNPIIAAIKDKYDTTDIIYTGNVGDRRIGDDTPVFLVKGNTILTQQECWDILNEYDKKVSSSGIETTIETTTEPTVN